MPVSNEQPTVSKEDIHFYRSYMAALKIFNKTYNTNVWAIPYKGTPEAAKIKQIRTMKDTSTFKAKTHKSDHPWRDFINKHSRNEGESYKEFLVRMASLYHSQTGDEITVLAKKKSAYNHNEPNEIEETEHKPTGLQTTKENIEFYTSNPVDWSKLKGKFKRDVLRDIKHHKINPNTFKDSRFKNDAIEFMSKNM